MPLPKVVLIESESQDAAAILHVIRDAHFYPILVSQPSELNRVLQDPLPQVILISSRIKGSDGFKLCDYLKSDRRYQNMTVGLLVHREDRGRYAKHRQSPTSADRYLFKPLNLREVEAFLESLELYDENEYDIFDESLETLDSFEEDYDFEEIEILEPEIEEDYEAKAFEFIDDEEQGALVEGQSLPQSGEYFEALDIETSDQVMISSEDLEDWVDLEETELEESLPNVDFGKPKRGDFQSRAKTVAYDEKDLWEQRVRDREFLIQDLKSRIKVLEEHCEENLKWKQKHQMLLKEYEALKDIQVTQRQMIRHLEEECDHLHAIEKSQQTQIERLQTEREEYFQKWKFLKKKLDQWEEKREGSVSSQAYRELEERHQNFKQEIREVLKALLEQLDD